MRKKTRRWRLGRLMLYTLFALMLLSWIPVLLMRWVPPPTSAFMLQQSHKPEYRYNWMDWDQLGTRPALAVMAAEDQKFPEHFGFDTGAIQNAVIDKLDGKPLRGASTISQQVAKNLFLWPGRQMTRKALEAWFTALIELSWPKQRILEVYLNIAEFGPGLYGIPEASRYFFGLDPAQLSDSQAAMLAAVLPNPVALQVNTPSDYLRERHRWIQDQMQQLRRDGWLEKLATRSEHLFQLACSPSPSVQNLLPRSLRS
jgi:monofunctional biosynthetic peptidoglycan transglycosylase